jgi:predicted 2-oxoglutarate/Fe(II)-dependent dioxygenase YbiX
MRKPNIDAHFDLHLVKGFFDPETCRNLITEMRCSPVGPAVTYGQGELGSINERVRKVSRVRPSPDTIGFVSQRLEQYRGQVENHFGISLNSFEEPQFLCYRVGDFFVAHQDGNTGLLMLDTDRSRRVSVTIFLNRQSEAPAADAYCGGTLVFSDWRAGREFHLSGEAGTLAAFRSEITHEVVPVTHGERYAIVSWYGVQ